MNVKEQIQQELIDLDKEISEVKMDLFNQVVVRGNDDEFAANLAIILAEKWIERIKLSHRLSLVVGAQNGT